MGIQLGSLKPRQRVARGSKVLDRWRTNRGSQSIPQARVRKFESLELESLKPREFENLKVRKVQSLKVRKVSNFGGLKVGNFQTSIV